MRLLQVDTTGGFSLTEDLTDSERLKYAILSHTWGKDDEEVMFEDLMKGTGQDKIGYRKISFCAEQAIRDGIQYIWVDTCCIHKSTNNIELQHAINSIIRWYQNSENGSFCHWSALYDPVTIKYVFPIIVPSFEASSPTSVS